MDIKIGLTVSSGFPIQHQVRYYLRHYTVMFKLKVYSSTQVASNLDNMNPSPPTPPQLAKVWKEGLYPPFPLLLNKNPASRSFFYCFPKSRFFYMVYMSSKNLISAKTTSTVLLSSWNCLFFCWLLDSLGQSIVCFDRRHHWALIWLICICC